MNIVLALKAHNEADVQPKVLLGDLEDMKERFETPLVKLVQHKKKLIRLKDAEAEGNTELDLESILSSSSTKKAPNPKKRAKAS